MMSKYYPQQRYVSAMARIKREALLPEEAVGSVRVEQGQRVDIRDNVARGLIPARHIIIEAARQLGLRHSDELGDLLLVERRRRVEAGTAIAGRDANRGKRVFAPVDGIVVYVGDGRIIMQAMPEIINLQAGVRGVVTRVYENRGISILAIGAVVQGIWGNGRNVVAPLRLQPPEGVEYMVREALEQAYRNEVVITNVPLNAATLEVATVRSFAGIIAPSMDADLIATALAAPFAILLTEGFGQYRMNNPVYSLLQELEGFQATVDAYLPRRWSARQPEVVINRPPSKDYDQQQLERALRVGMTVRIIREPYMGQTGQIIDLPNQPTLLDNGLRVKCACVELLPDDRVAIPLASLELAGG